MMVICISASTPDGRSWLTQCDAQRLLDVALGQRHASLTHPFALGRQVLHMNIAHPVCPTLNDRHRVRATLGDLAGVGCETDERGIEQAEQQLDFETCPDDRTPMWVHGGLDS